MAKTYSWIGSSGDFGNAANWQVSGVSDGTVPGPADTADIGAGTIGGSGTVDTLNFGGADIVVGSLTAVTNIDQTAGTLTVAGGASLAAAHYSQISDASDLVIQPGALVTIAGTINNPGPNSYLDAMYVSGMADFDGGTVNAGGQVNIGSATRVSAVTEEAGATARFWASNVGDAAGQAATLLLSGAGTTWTDAGGANSSGGYLLVGFRISDKCRHCGHRHDHGGRLALKRCERPNRRWGGRERNARHLGRRADDFWRQRGPDRVGCRQHRECRGRRDRVRVDGCRTTHRRSGRGGDAASQR